MFIMDNNNSVIVLAGRIRELRQAKGLSQKEFADSLGIVQGYLSCIERGRKIPSQTLLVALCHVYGVTEGWLFGGDERADEGKRPRSALPPAVREGAIPLLKAISQGFPDEVGDEDIADYVSLPGIGEGSFAIVAEGDFMAPTIRHGDLVIFRPGSELANRSIVLLNNKWGEVILRRCRQTEIGTWFSAENSAYTPFSLDPITRIFGTVIDVWRKVKL